MVVQSAAVTILLLLRCFQPSGKLLHEEALHVHAASPGHGLNVRIFRACCQLRVGRLPTCTAKHCLHPPAWRVVGRSRDGVGLCETKAHA